MSKEQHYFYANPDKDKPEWSGSEDEVAQF